jgi:hypothetical protein
MQVGGTLGTAVLGAVMSARISSLLPASWQAAHLPPLTGAQLAGVKSAVSVRAAPPKPTRASDPVAVPVQDLGYRNSGPWSLPARPSARWNAGMFVGDEVLLEVSFATAWERLARLTENDALASTSQDAYSHETTQVMRVGAVGLSKLVRVQVRELARTGKSAGLAIRWEATGQGGGLFPVLDADIRLAPAGEHATLLTMAGSYRPPFGALGEALDHAILHRVAVATVRGFLAQVAAQIGGQSGAAAVAPNGVS